MEILEFIKKHDDWEEILSDSPYHITIKRKHNFILLMYSQINSNFNKQIVRECRGLILEDKTFRPVCVPFFKFGNYGELYAADIHWQSAKVQEKVDGSLIKLWCYDDRWIVSTNGMIYASDAEMPGDLTEYRNYAQLFNAALDNYDLDFNKLDKEKTYMFELVSPFNRVVVPYKETALYHLGSRNNITFAEDDEYIGIPKPKVYPLHTLESCIKIAKDMSFSEEGYVVVDYDYNRIKIKSPAYVAAHYLKNGGVVTKSRVVEMIKMNEDEEFLNYYPEYSQFFVDMQDKIDSFEYNILMDIINAEDMKFDTRKEFAEYAKQCVYPAAMFKWYDNRLEKHLVPDFIMDMSSDKIVKLIGGD